MLVVTVLDLPGMNRVYLSFSAAVFFAILLCAPVVAQDLIEPGPDSPLPVCEVTEDVPVIIEAEAFEGVGPLLCAQGRVFFLQGNKRLRASRICYDTDDSIGVAENAVFTTCSREKPEYRLEAREVKLLPNNTLHARGVSLYIGNFKVLTLPFIKMRVGGRTGSRVVFPEPGYDEVDGFTLTQKFRLIDDERTRTTADISLTTKNSIQAKLGAVYAVNGTLAFPPGRYFTYDSMRESVLKLPQRPAGAQCDPQELRAPEAARLRLFGELAVKQRADDIDDEDLVVDRQPEIGFIYRGDQIYLARQRLDPRLEIYPQLSASWGRFKEKPGLPGYTQRSTISATVPVSILPLGPSTAVQPAVVYRISKYSTGDTYRTWALALDASHIFPGGSFVSGRYINWFESGTTPFRFDNIDVKQEFQVAMQLQSKYHIGALVLSYDLDDGDLYEYQVLYSHRSDCLQQTISWNSRLKRLSVRIRLVNI